MVDLGVIAYVEEECSADRLEINLLMLRLTTVFPRSISKHIEVLPFLFLMRLDPFQSFAIRSRLELQNIKKPLVLTLRIRLKPSKQLDSSPNAMGKIRPSRNRDHFALILVLALPRFGLASLGAISDFAATGACFGVDVHFRQTQCGGLLAFGFRRSFVETPCAGVLQALGV